MAISLDKILTVSLSDYFKSKGVTENPPTEPHHYDLVGVHITEQLNYPMSQDSNIKCFLSKVPLYAEAVVDYRYEFIYLSGHYHLIYSASGTALVPKKEFRKPEKIQPDY